MITMKYIYSLIFTLLSSSLIFAQSQEKHSQVLIDIDRINLVEYLNRQGLEIDHSHKHGNSLEVIISESDLEKLKQIEDINHLVVVDDVAASFQKMIKEHRSSFKMDCGLANFNEGSMGGYHSYEDMQDHIYEMQLAYPNLVHIEVIGQSYEGRDIIAVKISDNASEDENEPVAYYDALTHAREPMGLESILYYMWSLLENYDNDPELTYLVNNRELYFVPVVNPDGYVYNQTTNPDGGGLWRKNRRNNGDGTFGVDINRNYGDGWGLDIGSSDNTNSNTYRGTEAFSEPETRVIRDFTARINPSIALSNHSFSDVLLCPLGYSDDQPNHDLYSEFALDMIPKDYHGYGNWQQMIFYYGSGSTHDFLNEQGTIAMTPEIGHSFWEDPAVICDRIQEFYPSMKYAAWVSGDFIVYHNYILPEDFMIWEGQTNELQIRLKNKGLGRGAEQISVSLSSEDPRIQINNPLYLISRVEARHFNDEARFEFEVIDSVSANENIAFKVEVRQNGFLTSEQTIHLLAGEKEVIFVEDAENGIENWRSASNFEYTWDTTQVARYDGIRAISDSPNGNYEPSQSQSIVIQTPLDLSDKATPWLEFSAKWSMEPGIDFVELKLSDNGGETWFLLNGDYTDSSGKYTGHQSWVRERIDLNKHANKPNIILGFFINTDISREGDGFYFDDFSLTNFEVYEPTIVTSSVDFVADNIDIYPNPTDNQLFIDSTADIKLQLLEIFDALGQLHKKIALNGQNHRLIELSDLANGQYILRIQYDNDKSLYRKISVVK